MKPKDPAMSLKPIDFKDDAELLGVEVASIQAVADVEGGGSGFFKNGSPKILFEGHVFWRELVKIGIHPEPFVKGNEDILYKFWTTKHYKGGLGEYERLKRAERIHIDCALKSASWGMFQILGNKFAKCGFTTIDKFVAAMYIDENEHLMSFSKYIKGYYRLLKALKDHDWASFAKYYNGKYYYKNKYDIKLARAYAKYSNK